MSGTRCPYQDNEVTQEDKEMKRGRGLVFTATLMAFSSLWVAPGLGQSTPDGGQAAPSVSGTGVAGRIAVWKSSTTLGNSVLVQSSGNVGIGTAAPASKLDVTGDIDFTGSVRYQGSTFLQLPPGTSGLFGSNTGVGIGALQSNAAGINNTATGNNALLNNSAGSANTALGSGALFSNTSGNDNTASGINVLISNTTGTGNTGNGAIALNVNTTGSSNTAVGFATLIFNTTGNANTAIGFNAGEFLGSGDDNVYISNVGPGTFQNPGSESGVIRIGTPGTQTSAFIAGIYGSSTGLQGVPVVIDMNGNLGTISSSRRYKEDIHEMGDASDGLMRLRPVTFRYKKPFDDGSKVVQYGLIAEEVAEVYPDLVARSADGQIESVKYQLLDPMLVNELQKLNAMIMAQKAQIRSLEERLARVETALGTASVTTAAR
jgi:hypothetical protein